MSLSIFSTRLTPAMRRQTLSRFATPAAFTSMRNYATKFYTERHEWVEIDDGIATIGITDFGRKSLGEIGFIQISETDAYLKGERLAVVMSEKGEKVLQFPISGKKVSINTDVHMNPKLLNSDPESKGWICKVKPFDDKLKQETESLLNEEAYKKLIK